MLKEHITPTHRPMGDRSQTVGASEIGQCARSVWFRKRGQEPEREDGWGFRERGHVIEAWVMDRLAAAGVPVENVQRQLVQGHLSCTVDLVLNGEPIDLKSIDPRATKLPKPAHVLQSQVQSALWGAERGWLVYVDASDFSSIREFAIPAVDITPLHERATAIMTGDMPLPEGRITGGDECQWCPFQTACLGAPIEDKGHLSDEDKQSLELAVATVKRAEDAKKEQEVVAAASRELIREILRAADVRRAPGLARIARSARTSLDTEAMERDGLDLSKYRKPGRVSETVTVE
jgi:hypothetical protein